MTNLSVQESKKARRCLVAAAALTLTLAVLSAPLAPIAYAAHLEGPINAAPEAYEWVDDGGLLAQSFDYDDVLFAQATGGTSVVPLTMTLDAMTRAQQTRGYREKYSYDEVRNALDPNRLNLTVFADLTVSSGLTGSQINAFIDSTSNGRNGMLHGKGEVFIRAQEKYKVSAAYLVAHSVLETGWGTSTLSKGQTFQGKTYYNFFGIGAFDGVADSAGLSKAVEEGWDTPEKAIDGGAQWIAYNYIHGEKYPKYPQPTLYSMMWDYLRENVEGSSWHQYCTGISWHTQIARLMDDAYVAAQKTPNFDYVVPQYKGENIPQANGRIVYRLYNSRTKEHLYTTDWLERATLERGGWDYEGVGWIAPNGSGVPVYRICDVNSGEHLYTRDENERNVRVREGWRDEGIGWYSADNGSKIVRRHYNPAAGLGSHHYTADENESNHLISNAGWKDEGIAWRGI